MIISSDGYTQIIVTLTIMIILSIIGVLCIKYWDKISTYCKYYTSKKVSPETIVVNKFKLEMKEIYVN
jgi:hypothetical protein